VWCETPIIGLLRPLKRGGLIVRTVVWWVFDGFLFFPSLQNTSSTLFSHSLSYPLPVALWASETANCWTGRPVTFTNLLKCWPSWCRTWDVRLIPGDSINLWVPRNTYRKRYSLPWVWDPSASPCKLAHPDDVTRVHFFIIRFTGPDGAHRVCYLCSILASWVRPMRAALQTPLLNASRS
jgi:hypothetical protein